MLGSQSKSRRRAGWCEVSAPTLFQRPRRPSPSRTSSRCRSQILTTSKPALSELFLGTCYRCPNFLLHVVMVDTLIFPVVLNTGSLGPGAHSRVAFVKMLLLSVPMEFAEV